MGGARADSALEVERIRWRFHVVPEAGTGVVDGATEFATRQRIDVDLRFSDWNADVSLPEPAMAR